MGRNLINDVRKSHIIAIVATAFVATAFVATISFTTVFMKCEISLMGQRLISINGMMEDQLIIARGADRLLNMTRNRDKEGLFDLMEPVVLRTTKRLDGNYVVGFYSRTLDQNIIGRSSGGVNLDGGRLGSGDPGRQVWRTRKPRISLLRSSIRKVWVLKCDSPIVIDGYVVGHTFSNVTLNHLINAIGTVAILALLALAIGCSLVVTGADRFVRRLQRNLIALNIRNSDSVFDYDQFRDIAEENRMYLNTAQEAYAKVIAKEKNQEAMLDNIPWGYIIADGDGRYIDINQRGAEILGIGREAVIGKRIGDSRLHDSPIQKALLEKTVVESDMNFETRYGIKTLYVHAFPLPLESGREGAMAWYVDLTGQKKMELSIQHMDRLSTIGEMLSIVAHDIRNPLTVIKSQAQLACLMPDKVNHIEQWRKVDLSVDSMTMYLERVLTFCKPSGEALKCCDVSELYKNVMAMLRSKIGYSKVTVNEEIQTRSLVVRVNPLDFQYVLLNLLNNAYESISGEGTITFRVDSIDTYVRVQIIDTGSGISREILDKIWDMFYTTKEKGTGIGLAMAKRVVEKCGGSISVISTVGSGTTFTIMLPQADSNESNNHGAVGNF